jgi:aminopeptidase N
MSRKAVQYRSDYRAPAFTIDQLDLHFDLSEQATEVRGLMRVRRQASGALQLHGEQLQLKHLKIDGQVLASDRYEVSDTELRIDDVPDAFELEIVTVVNPSANSALEGLYLSGGAFCTQCEAEGFRRIMYYLDRPDVLAVFTTTVVADAQRYPFLLANGNLIEEGQLDDGRHFATWHDPHPKPSYLFALVAGDFDRIEDHYTTIEGRKVKLEIFVDKGNAQRAEYAMGALKRSMQWDEQRFSLAYDLDRYMIVAVDFFNMGAMENKGLNIFNSKYVLASQETATDWDFIHVESVIGHEYFHNWTGNRITCRDWFQLSLKEGLTVFRDQEFSADLGSRAVHRIDAIRVMRSHQFNEDASPMAHPIRPDKVQEMNNFYTVTVYNKGAEVIRMLHTLLGEQGFQAGMRLYRERHDGQAVTCEDFVAALEDANQSDLSQFRRWYSQAGTPEVTITQKYDAATETLKVHLRQQTPATPGQTAKQAVVIPILLSAYSQQGERIELQGEPTVVRHESGSQLLVFDSAEMTVSFSNVKTQPVLAWLENFSAPVKLEQPISVEELAVLLGHAEQEVTRWEAAQRIFIALLRQAVAQSAQVKLSELERRALQQVLEADLDPALVAMILTPPSAEELLEYYPSAIPLAAIELATRSLEYQLAVQLQQPLAECFQRLQPKDDDLSARAMAERALKNRCLRLLAAAQPENFNDVVEQQALRQGNMTQQHAALEIAVHQQLPCKTAVLAEFAKQWQSTPLVMDKWFAVQASAVHEHTVSDVERLLEHEAFNLRNPNRVYSLLATFARNSLRFHQQDGAGYQLLQRIITQLNTLNPQVAARLITPFLQYKRFDETRCANMQKVLEELKEIPQLATDLEEKINLALGI